MSAPITRLAAGVALSLAASVTSAVAQSDSVDRAQRVDQAQASTRSAFTSGVVPGTQVVAPSILATIVSKDKLARATFGVLRSTGKFEWNPWIMVSGPLDESDATLPVVIADLSGMRATTKAAVGLNLQHWNWSVDTAEQKRLCRKLFRDPLLVQGDLRAPIQAALNLKTAQEIEERLSRVADSLAAKQCNTESFVRREDRDALRKQVDFGRIFLAGIGVEYGRQSFRYADTLTATFATRMESPAAAVLGAGLYFPTTGVLASANVRLERSVAGAAPSQYCVPTGLSPSLQCRNVALAAPSTNELLLATTEVRWFANGSLGLNPRFTADLRGKRGYGVEIPILLKQPTDQGFSTALSFGWRSRKTTEEIDDRAYIALSLGVNFDIGLALLK
jgi:hypothetical protein